MDFVLALHSHLPYVLNHGRWPHGSDWLCEAALDTYLPLLEHLRRLDADRIPAPVTIGITPVLANQLASPTFVTEMETFFEHRLATCDEAPASLAATGEGRLLPLVDFWRERLTRLREFFHQIDGDILAALRALERAGRLETIGSAATHGFLPLLARDESIRLQLALGRAEHRGSSAARRKGSGFPNAPTGHADPGGRRGSPPPPASAAASRSTWPMPASAIASWTRTWHPPGARSASTATPRRIAIVPRSTGRLGGIAHRSPYVAYQIAPTRRDGVAALVRDPRSSLQVWSRYQGYPGDARYLEFHKMRWPGGLKLWRVSGGDVDLGAKEPYDPWSRSARERARRPLRRAAGGDRVRGAPPARGGGGGAVRYRAVRTLVVRGARLARGGLPGAGA